MEARPLRLAYLLQVSLLLYIYNSSPIPTDPASLAQTASSLGILLSPALLFYSYLWTYNFFSCLHPLLITPPFLQTLSCIVWLANTLPGLEWIHRHTL